LILFHFRQILNRKKLGCFPVPMVHSCVLVDLRRQESDLLTYLPDNIPDYPGGWQTFSFLLHF
jgi:collagen beta-1,O-galactosyltransferase